MIGIIMEDLKSIVDAFLSAENEDQERAEICKMIKLDPQEVVLAASGWVSMEGGKWQFLCAWALGELGFPSSPFHQKRVDLLAGLLAKQPAPCTRVVARAVRSLGQLGGAEAYSAIFPLHSSDQEDVRSAVAASLDPNFSDDSLELLHRLLRDESNIVRGWAALSIGNAMEDRAGIAQTILFEARNDSDPDVRYEIASALGLLKDVRVINFIADLCEDEGIDLRLCDALRYIGESNDIVFSKHSAEDKQS